MASGTEPTAPDSATGGQRTLHATGRVLLVDDSALVRDFVGGLIVDWGFLVEVVVGGRAALTALDHGSFDVIVADINMPEMSGLELLTTLRMRAVETPVIMLSSVSRTGEVLRAIHQGAFDYVVKDEAIEPLRLALLRAVEHVRLVNENARLLGELQRLNAELEGRVRERTGALELANTRLLAERGQLEATDRHDVLTFSDPRDGMRCLIEREPPDIIICDVNMPHVSGLDLYRQVTQLRPFLAERFIFLTGGESQELASLLADSPRRILEKPVHRKDLIAAIESVSAARGSQDLP